MLHSSSAAACSCGPHDVASDCTALCDLYHATGQQLAYLGWGNGSSICTWALQHGDQRTGILCDEATGRPSEVVLEQLFPPMGGTLPSSLGLLSTLKKLSLWQNDVSGSLPRTLGGKSLPSLSSLNLDNNKFSGTIASSLGGTRALTALALSSNRISGTLPPELGDLRGLTILWGSENALSGTLPPELGKAGGGSLVYLDLFDNPRISGTLPAALLANASRLTTLDLSSTGLQDLSRSGRAGGGALSGTLPALDWERSLPSLSWFNLRGHAALSGSLPPSFCELMGRASVDCDLRPGGAFERPIPDGCAKCKVRTAMLPPRRTPLYGWLPLS